MQYSPPESLTLTCPVCRQQSILPQEGVPGLQANHFISALMEDEPPMDEVLSCPKHAAQTLRFFCADCETAVCVTCTDIEHGGHATLRMRDAVQEHKAQLSRLLERAQQQVPALDEALEAMAKISKELEANVQSSSSQLEESFRLLSETLDRRKKELLHQIEERRRLKEAVLDAQRERLEACRNQLETTCRFTERALAHGTDTELLMLHKQVSEKLTELALMRADEEQPEENSHVSFRNSGDLVRAVAEFGSVLSSSAIAWQTTASGEGLKAAPVGRPVVVCVTTKDRRGDIVDCPSGSLRSSLSNESESYADLNQPMLTEVKSGSYELSFVLPREGIYLLDIFLFDSPIRGSPFHVNGTEEENSDRPASSKIPRTAPGVRQRSGKRPPSYRSGGSNRKSNPIEDDLVMRIGVKGRSKGQFTNPQGVACSAQGKILVADSNNQCVQVFNSAGEIELRFGVRGRGPGQMQRPTGLCITAAGNYAVADYENKCVNLFESTGKFLSRLGTGKLLGPKGLALDRNGHIVVVDNKASTVLVFQENGKLLYRFGSRGNGQEKFAGPHYAAVNSKNQIVVSDFHNHCIKIFDGEGNFVNSFGSNGEGNGQFNAPTGVAVDSQDNIIVADWGNSRLQVFDATGSFLSFVNGEPLYGPQGLALTPDNYVAVADSGNHCIKVFKYLQ